MAEKIEFPDDEGAAPAAPAPENAFPAGAAPAEKRKRGRPKGSKTKKKAAPPEPAGDPADPFAEPAKPPPARRPEITATEAADELLPAEELAPEKPRLGEAGAREILPVVYLAIDAGGVALASFVFRKAPEEFRKTVREVMPLSPEERERLEPAFVRRLAELEISEDESFFWTVAGIFGMKLLGLYALSRAPAESTAFPAAVPAAG